MAINYQAVTRLIDQVKTWIKSEDVHKEYLEGYLDALEDMEKNIRTMNDSNK